MKPNDKEIQIGQVFEQSRQNAEQITDLRTDFSNAIGDLRKSIDRLGERLSVATAPNFSTMASWGGILLTIIAMVAAPVAYYFNHSLESLDSKLQKEYQLVNGTLDEKVASQRRALDELDTRLQREFLTANQTTKETATVLKDTWNDRHIDLMNRVSELEKWNSDRTKADLEELRQRRMQK